MIHSGFTLSAEGLNDFCGKENTYFANEDGTTGDLSIFLIVQCSVVVPAFPVAGLSGQREFAEHQWISRLLGGVPVYFTDSYSSWQKGAVENTNKLIRQYIPKGTNISMITDNYRRKSTGDQEKS